MAYQKQTWEDLPSTNTPITVERLNHMEEGIANAVETDSVARVTNVVSRNKAGLKEIAWLQSMDYINTTSNGIKYKSKAEQYAGFNLTLSKSLEIGKEYTLSFKNNSSDKIIFSIVKSNNGWQNDYDNAYVTSLHIDGNTSYSYTFTALTNIIGIMIMCSTSSNADINERNIIDIQLEEGSTSTPYTPYLNMQELQEKSNDTGWIDVPLTADASTLDWCKFQYRKLNGIVFINGIFKLLTPSWSKTIGQLPNGFRPLHESDFVCRGVDNSSVIIAIGPDGKITFLDTVNSIYSTEFVGGIISASFIADN